MGNLLPFCMVLFGAYIIATGKVPATYGVVFMLVGLAFIQINYVVGKVMRYLTDKEAVRWLD